MVIEIFSHGPTHFYCNHHAKNGLPV